METNEASPIYRYAKRAIFIIDETGTVKSVKVMDNPLDLLNPDDEGWRKDPRTRSCRVCGQTTLTSKLRRGDFGGCGPPQ